MGFAASDNRIVTTDPDAVDDSRTTIAHIDMDAFFALVELRRHPELRGRPMLVGSTSGRGVVLSATYEARRYGVRSAMPVGQALRLCPHVAIVEPDQRTYHEVSREVMTICADVTPLVEQLSVDEAFLELRGARRTGGRPVQIATNLRQRISDELGLTASVGLARTKFLAKLASGLCKPDGLLVIPPAEELAVLHPLGVRALWGIGPTAEAKLHSWGIRTVGELARLELAQLTKLLGSAAAQKAHDLAWSRDDREVEPVVAEKSIGAETTFAVDTAEPAILHRELLALAEKTARRARSAGITGRTIAIKVRFTDFSTLTRAVTVSAPTASSRVLYRAAVELLGKLGELTPVRLLGVRLENLDDTEPQQLSFDDTATEPTTDPWQDAETTSDAVAARFGDAALRPASLLPRKQSRKLPRKQPRSRGDSADR